MTPTVRLVTDLPVSCLSVSEIEVTFTYQIGTASIPCETLVGSRNARLSDLTQEHLRIDRGPNMTSSPMSPP